MVHEGPYKKNVLKGLRNSDYSYNNVVCLRVQGKAVNTPVQNTKEITIRNGYVKIHSLFLEFVVKRKEQEQQRGKE